MSRVEGCGRVEKEEGAQRSESAVSEVRSIFGCFLSRKLFQVRDVERFHNIHKSHNAVL